MRLDVKKYFKKNVRFNKFSKLFSISLLIFIITFSFSACSLFNESVNTNTEGAAENSTAAGMEDSSAQDNSVVTETEQDVSTVDNNTASGKSIKVTLYFATEDNSALKKEERDVKVVDGAILKACVLALIEGPSTQGLRQTVPAETELRGISVKDKIATVDLSKEFLQTNGVAEIVARLSIVNTLTGINGIEKVKLHIDGEDMIGPSGNPLGAMSPVLLDEEGKPVAGDRKTVTLYFSDSEAMYVVAEKRDIVQSENDSIEKAAFIELMKGPETKDLHAVIPKGTKLLSINTSNGLCTVDLSNEFIDNNPGGTASERMTLTSIVNTLTEIEGINKVQFLINGEKREIYTHAIFDKPFVRDESVIKK